MSASVETILIIEYQEVYKFTTPMSAGVMILVKIGMETIARPREITDASV